MIDGDSEQLPISGCNVDDVYLFCLHRLLDDFDHVIYRRVQAP